MTFKYFKLIRIWQWPKNLVILIPLVLSRKYSVELLKDSIEIFILFSFFVSGTYIFNDIKDKDLDITHPEKKFRPIASGEIKVRTAIVLGSFLIITSSIAVFYFFNFQIYILFIFYLIFTSLYSLYFKYLNFIDSISITFLFLIRLLIGSKVSYVDITPYLYLFLSTFCIFIVYLKKNSIIKKNIINNNIFFKKLSFQNFYFSFLKILYLIGFMNILSFYFWGKKFINFLDFNDLLAFFVFLCMYIFFVYKLIKLSEEGRTEDFVLILFSKEILPILFILVFIFSYFYFDFLIN